MPPKKTRKAQWVAHTDTTAKDNPLAIDFRTANPNAPAQKIYRRYNTTWPHDSLDTRKTTDGIRHPDSMHPPRKKYQVNKK
ncbi:MAG TPA: hypothetical protein VFF13_00590 [archaeon]|nr:hypothetical protein [archaeon]